MQEGNNFDDDPDFSSALLSAARLLAECVSADCRRDSIADVADAILDLLIRVGTSAPVDLEGEQKRIADGADVSSLSASVAHAVALGGVLSWIAGFPDSGLVSRALKHIESKLPPSSESLADAVAVAKNIAVLVGNHADWLREHLDNLYGTDTPGAAQKAALSATLSAFRPNMLLLDLLLPKMMVALKLGLDGYPQCVGISGRIDFDVCAGSWIFRGILLGHLRVGDSEFEAWESRASNKAKSNCLKELCHVVCNSGEMPSENRVFFEELYAHYEVMSETEERFFIDPISNHWLMKSGQFEQAWWVERYLRSERAHPDHNAIRMSQNEIIALSYSDPASSLELMRLGLEDADRNNGFLGILARHMAPAILANALCSRDDDLVKEAVRLRDWLGFKGLANLDERIDQERLKIEGV